MKHVFPYRQDLWKELPQKRPNLGKFNIQKLFSLTKNRKKPKIEALCTQQVYWSNSACFYFFHLPSITNELLVPAVMH